MADRFLIASRALLFYPMKLVWPWPLVFIYPRWEINDQDVWAYWSVAAVLAVGAAAVVAFLRGWRGPALALAYFAGTVFPALGFFNIYPMAYSFVADHFQYLASLGVIALLVGGAAWWLANPQRLLVAASPVLLILLALTVNQSSVYRDSETLWAHTLAHNERSWMAHNNMSITLLRRATEVRARGDQATSNLLLSRGFTHLCRAMDLHPPLREAVIEKDVNMQKVYAAHLLRENRPWEALDTFAEVVRRNPLDADARGRLIDSLATARTALSMASGEQPVLRRRFADALEALAISQTQAGQTEAAGAVAAEAIDQFTRLGLNDRALAVRDRFLAPTP